MHVTPTLVLQMIVTLALFPWEGKDEIHGDESQESWKQDRQELLTYGIVLTHGIACNYQQETSGNRLQVPFVYFGKS